MFVVVISYTKPVEEVDHFRQDHLAFIQQHIDQGIILLAGRQQPAVGGLFIANADSKEVVEQFMQNDPYVINQVASFKVIEFNPAKAHPTCQHLL